jgi:hypothetical protein
LHMLGKCCTTGPHPQPRFIFLHSSVAFSIFTGSRSHHHCLIPGHFCYPTRNLTPLTLHTPHPTSSFPSSWLSLMYFLSLWIDLGWTLHVNGTVLCVAFCVWLHCLVWCPQSASMLYRVSGFHSFPGWIAFHCMNRPRFAPLFLSWWPCLGYRFCFADTCSYELGISGTLHVIDSHDPSVLSDGFTLPHYACRMLGVSQCLLRPMVCLPVTLLTSSREPNGRREL